MKKISGILIVILGIILFINNYVYGSFADYSDEDAEKDTQVMIEEHEKKFDNTKSENNFLKSLSVSGGVLSPDFDRQIVEYSIRVGSNINEIDIMANPEDEKAKINGNGKIKINDISECKIEVIAASGATRTYFIKIIKETEESANDSNSVINSEINEKITLSENSVEQNDFNEGTTGENKEAKRDLLMIEDGTVYKKYIIVGIALFIVVFFLAFIIKTNNKSKH